MFQQENISLINNNILSNENNNILINQYKEKIIEDSFNNKILLNSYKNNIMSFGNGNKIKLNYHHIKYGIDENGNPINIKEYYKSINDSVNLNSNSSMQSGISNFTQKLKKPIAYITKDENNNNILVDLKGNKITTKNKEGDYDFNLQLHVIIKDFDVKHPELRINGERNYNNESIEEINEEPSENIKDNYKEKDCSHTNKNIGDSLSNINFNFNYNNENNGLMAGSCFSSSVKNDLDKLIFRTNTDNYNNIGKYKNIVEKNSRNNKIVLRTKNILTNSNTNSSVFKNISSQNTYMNFGLENEYKYLNKNKSQIIPLKRSNTVNSNFVNFKNQRDLITNKKDDVKIKKKAIKLLLINNHTTKINKENKESQIIDNKSDNYPRIINSDKKTKNKANCPRKINSEKNTIQKSIKQNFYNNKKMATSTTLLNNNIINKDTKISKNYFVIKHKKSFSNSKLIKKNYKRPNKKVNIIQINDRKNSSTTNNTIVHNKKENNPNVSSNVIHKITKRKILKKDLSQKSKKIEIPKKEKILYLKSKLKKNNSNFILSEEANNMIRSFSKNNIGKENQLNSSIKKIHANKMNFKVTKKIPISKDSSSINNSLNLDNTYFSPTNKNNRTNFQNGQKFSRYDSNEINEQKCVGITLSLLNNESKNLKGNTNNQININFAPYQIQCESLVKNNNDNPHQKVYYNNSEKKSSKPNRKYNMNHINKDFLSPKYQIYL